MDIAKVAKLSGLPASTLRYYESKGLIRSIGRNGLRRVFDKSVLEQLEFIALGQVAGFELDDIGMMFCTNGQYEVDRALLNQKADQLDNQIKQLEAIRNSLRHAAVCPAPRHSECPKFQRLLRIAVKRQTKKRGKGIGGV